MTVRGGAPTEIAERRAAESGVRCACPICLGLDVMFPGGGYQLAFWPYEGPPGETPRLLLHFVRKA